MTKFEYIILNDDFDDRPTTADILKRVEECSWNYIESKYAHAESVIEKIVKNYCSTLEYYDEGDEFYIAIKKMEDNGFEIYHASLAYILDVCTNRIHVEEHVKEETM